MGEELPAIDFSKAVFPAPISFGELVAKFVTGRDVSTHFSGLQSCKGCTGGNRAYCAILGF